MDNEERFWYSSIAIFKNSQETLSRWGKTYSTMGQGSSMEGITDFTEQEENTDPFFASI